MELERIRACVATALSDLHYLQRGILEVQLEQLRLANSGRFTDKPTRVIQMGENNKYEISVAAEQVRYHVGKTFKQSSMLLTELDFQTASWRRAIEQLNQRKLPGCIIAMAVSPILKMMKLYASGYGWIFLSLIQSLISKK